MSELTKGPWKAKRLATYQEPGWVVLWPDKGGTHMRRLDSNGNFTGPDAALIAAAPELLAAAKKVNALSIQTEAHKELRAAIAKATEHDAERQVRASDMTKLIAELAQQQADDRAHRIATMAAEELIRTEGVTTSGIDEFEIAADLLDDHMFDCVAHLCDIGAATQCDGRDGSLIVQLGDFT